MCIYNLLNLFQSVTFRKFLNNKDVSNFCTNIFVILILNPLSEIFHKIFYYHIVNLLGCLIIWFQNFLLVLLQSHRLKNVKDQISFKTLFPQDTFRNFFLFKISLTKKPEFCFQSYLFQVIKITQKKFWRKIGHSIYELYFFSYYLY